MVHGHNSQFMNNLSHWLRIGNCIIITRRFRKASRHKGVGKCVNNGSSKRRHLATECRPFESSGNMLFKHLSEEDAGRRQPLLRTTRQRLRIINPPFQHSTASKSKQCSSQRNHEPLSSRIPQSLENRHHFDASINSEIQHVPLRVIIASMHHLPSHPQQPQLCRSQQWTRIQALVMPHLLSLAIDNPAAKLQTTNSQ